MHPLFIIGAIAGAFLLGRKSAEKDKPSGTKGPRPSPIPLPLPDVDVDDIDVPELPTDLDLPAQTSGSPSQRQIINAALWAKLGHDVLVFPKGANKTLVAPPQSSSGITASAGCAVIAVGARWWDRAGQVAKNLAAHNALTRDNLERALFPAICRGSRGAGAAALRADMLDRVSAEFGPIRNGHRARRRSGARWWMR
jgi:hypothetical protein